MKKRVYVRVFGCQMNVYDADRIKTSLAELGYLVNESSEKDSDVVIFVTCSVRQKAEQKLLSEIGRLNALYKRKKKPNIVIVGCSAQNLGEYFIKRFDAVKGIVGPRMLSFVPEVVKRVFKGKKNLVYLNPDRNKIEDINCIPKFRSFKKHAFVTIAHGCNQFCTYCIVPFLRGAFWSRKPQDILNEIRLLVEDGVLEVTLLGQNVDSYGTDFKDIDYKFPDLLEDVAKIDELVWIRFTTSHPKDFSLRLIDVIARNPKICRGINLPVQHGSDNILRKMARGYTIQEYKEIIHSLRSKLKDVCITTDIIVGFPGETEEDFKKTLEFIKEMKFDMIHTAAYSPRPHTKAALMKDQLPQEIKQKRLNLLNRIQKEIAYEINQKFVGKTEIVLVHDKAPKGEGLYEGRTYLDKTVIIKGADRDIVGEFVEVKIKDAKSWFLEGEFIKTLSVDEVKAIFS